VVGGQELRVQVPLPMAEVWAELQAQVEELAAQAGLHILRTILENEVTHRVGPPHRPDLSAGCALGQAAATKTGHHQPDRIVFVDGAEHSKKRKTLATRISTTALAATGLLEAEKKFRRIKAIKSFSC
jgi:hypothetical protein